MNWSPRCLAALLATHLSTLLSRHVYLGEAKATMAMLGVDVGPARLPRNKRSLRSELEPLGFFVQIRI